MKDFNANNRSNQNPKLYIDIVFYCSLVYGPTIAMLFLHLYRARNAKRQSVFLINSLDRQYNNLITASQADTSIICTRLSTLLNEATNLSIFIPDTLKDKINLLGKHMKSYPRLNSQSKSSRSEYAWVINAHTEHHEETKDLAAACLFELEALVEPENERAVTNRV